MATGPAKDLSFDKFLKFITKWWLRIIFQSQKNSQNYRVRLYSLIHLSFWGFKGHECHETIRDLTNLSFCNRGHDHLTTLAKFRRLVGKPRVGRMGGTFKRQSPEIKGWFLDGFNSSLLATNVDGTTESADACTRYLGSTKYRTFISDENWTALQLDQKLGEINRSFSLRKSLRMVMSWNSKQRSSFDLLFHVSALMQEKRLGSHWMQRVTSRNLLLMKFTIKRSGW